MDIERNPFEIDESDGLAELFEIGDCLEKEDIVSLPISEIRSFKNHPFKVDDDELELLKNSIEENGVLNPVIVRQDEKGFEMISGHRRKRACELLGIDEIPCVIKELDNDTASVLMVDANIQREHICPSEKAKAYRIKYDALKHQGKQVESVGNTAELVGKKAGDSGRTVQRYYRLSYLNDALLDAVDENKLKFNAGVILAGLSEEIQDIVVQYYSTKGKMPSERQAKSIKDYVAEYSDFSLEKLKDIMHEEQKTTNTKKISVNKIEKFFPVGTSTVEMEKKIIALLEADANK